MQRGRRRQDDGVDVGIRQKAVEGCRPVDLESRRHAARQRLVSIDSADEFGRASAPGEVGCVDETDPSEPGDPEANALHRPSVPFSPVTKRGRLSVDAG